MNNNLEGTKLNFKEIFSQEFKINDNEKSRIKIIEIPMLQRDYAHGRKLPSVNAIRKNFLDDIFNAITKGEELTLDFIYGDLKDEKLIPLDGQQRLTTLFLLYWYAFKRENIEDDNFRLYSPSKDEIRPIFNYETRVSARNFCSFLINKFQPDFSSDNDISEQINNNKKFPSSYNDDPTVASMLVMLDAIHKKYNEEFKNSEKRLYEGLNKHIKFFFLPIEDMGNTEQLYINMNSRGKMLTDFENIKAELKKLMEENGTDKKIISDMMNKFDGEWTDAIWKLCNEPEKIDKIFVQYIRFVCDILCFENKYLTIDKRVPEDENWNDELTIIQLIQKYFSIDETKYAKDNTETLYKYLGYIIKLKEFEKDFDSEFYKEKYFYPKNNNNIDNEKIRDFGGFLDIVEKSITSGNVERIKPIEFLKLYTIISSFKNENLREEELKKRFRIIRNLISYSSDEAQVRRKADNHFPLALKQIDYIMKTGKIADIAAKEIQLEFEDGIKPDYQRIDFNKVQKEEETQKAKFYDDEYKSLLKRLEDNELLQGKISIIGMNPMYWLRFEKLFKFCDRELIDKAMMVAGEGIYGIDVSSKHQFGCVQSDTSWYNIFSNWEKGENENNYHNQEKLKVILGIEQLDEINAETGKSKKEAENQLKTIINQYISTCENNKTYDFRYYYVKYYDDNFKPVGYGKYDFEGNDKNYECWVMETPKNRSSYSYQPFLKKYQTEQNKKNDIGQKGVVAIYLDDNKEKYIESKKEGLLITNTKSSEKRLVRTVNKKGIDKEDRIELLENIIKNPECY